MIFLKKYRFYITLALLFILLMLLGFINQESKLYAVFALIFLIVLLIFIVQILWFIIQTFRGKTNIDSRNWFVRVFDKRRLIWLVATITMGILIPILEDTYGIGSTQAMFLVPVIFISFLGLIGFDRMIMKSLSEIKNELNDIYENDKNTEVKNETTNNLTEDKQTKKKKINKKEEALTSGLINIFKGIYNFLVLGKIWNIPNWLTLSFFLIVFNCDFSGSGRINGYYQSQIGREVGADGLTFNGDTVKSAGCECNLVLVDEEKKVYRITGCPRKGVNGCTTSAMFEYTNGKYVHKFFNDNWNNYCVRVGPTISSVLNPMGGAEPYCK